MKSKSPKVKLVFSLALRRRLPIRRKFSNEQDGCFVRVSKSKEVAFTKRVSACESPSARVLFVPELVRKAL